MGTKTKKKCVMVVEDEQAIRELLGEIMEDVLDHDVILEEDGEAALNRLMQHGLVDLIISDLDMPVLDGRQLVRKLKASEEWRNIPVVLMSGLSKEEATRLCDDGFADKFIGKPFGVPEIMQLVTRLLA